MDITDAVLGKAGLARCTDLELADVFAVPDLSKIGQRISWNAGLNGCIVASEAFIRSGGIRGPAIVYKRATSITRMIWLSDLFMASHSMLAGFVWAACARNGSKWSFIADRREFIAIAEKSNAAKMPTRCLALINKSEKLDKDRWQ